MQEAALVDRRADVMLQGRMGFLAPLWWTNAGTFVVLSGGLAVVLTRDGGDAEARWFLPQLGLWLLTGILAAALGRLLHRRHGRTLWLATVMAVLMAVGTLVFLNVGASLLVVPAWPARGLHGVRPEVWAKAFASDGKDASAWNAWGQRDRARTPLPPPGVKRVALVGDSLLEEGSATPLNLGVEAVMHNAAVEVVNLGVSATAPDEYFYRVRHIALPLGARHVMMFLYAGNDVIEKRTLRSAMGVTATYPRDSLMDVLGLQALTHVTMNWRRPLVAAWGNGGEELSAERALHQAIRESSSEALVQRFGHHVDEAHQPALMARLRDPAVENFWAMVKAPDGGLFRSYYLWPALENAAGLPSPSSPGAEFTAQWPIRAAQLCREQGVGFTAVLVPEAFSVDDRMVDQWKPVADMRLVMGARHDAIEDVGRRAREAGVDVLDLHEALLHSRGTYLNMDGHWSQAGVDLVAGVVAQHLARVLP